MLRVVVDDQSFKDVVVRTGEKNGRTWRMAQQPVWIKLPNASFPERYVIPLPDGSTGYPPGQYNLDLESMLCRASYDAMSLNFRGGVLLSFVSSLDKKQI